MRFGDFLSIGNSACYNLLVSFIGYQGEKFALLKLSLGRESPRRESNLDSLDESCCSRSELGESLHVIGVGPMW